MYESREVVGRVSVLGSNRLLCRAALLQDQTLLKSLIADTKHVSTISQPLNDLDRSRLPVTIAALQGQTKALRSHWLWTTRDECLRELEDVRAALEGDDEAQAHQPRGSRGFSPQCRFRLADSTAFRRRRSDRSQSASAPSDQGGFQERSDFGRRNSL